MADNLEKKIREYNREILRLKTAHPVASNMITFYGVFNWDNDEDGKTHIYEISYVAGTQPIMTWIAFAEQSNEGYVKFGEPSGDKQLLYDTGAYHSTQDRFALLSTRQIISLRKIS